MLKIFNDLVVSDNLDEVMASPNPITSDYFISVYIERGAVQFTLEGQTYHAPLIFSVAPNASSRIACLSSESSIAIFS